jgi:pimeloyl-ACP methyl ester carboxylesterase
MTKLIEFNDPRGATLRGLFDSARSSVGVVFLHGFEHSTVEYKFKNLVDVWRGRYNLWRFDLPGCGLSDGEFSDFTISGAAEVLRLAIRQLHRLAPQVKEVIFVGHSAAGSIVLEYLKSEARTFNKMILLAPAFNQAALLRYYFARQTHRDEKITWGNYEKFFSPVAFKLSLKAPRIMRKAHYLKNHYFKESSDRDYQEYFSDIDFDWSKLTIIHGDADDKVPLASNNKLPRVARLIVVKGGDHELERPDMVKQYLRKII